MRVLMVAAKPLKMPRLLQEYQTLRKAGYNVDILIPRVNTYKGPRLFSAFIRYLAYAIQTIIRGADVVHVFNVPDIVCLFPSFKRAKFILDIRTPWFLKLEERYPWLISLAKGLENYLTKKADIVITANDPMAKRAKVLGAKKVFVVPNYPPENFAPSQDPLAFREERGARDKKVVLYVGMLHPGRKGLMYLLKAIKEVVQTKKDVMFWIVGDGELRPLLERKLEDFIQRGNVYFARWRPRDEIPTWIAAVDVCVEPESLPHPEFFNEQNIWKISEYSALQRPIVACGIAKSDQYLLVEKEKLGEGILKALEGKTPKPKRKTWTISEKALLNAYNQLV